MSNPYYNPGDLGLEIVAEHDFSDGCYQFDLRVVWKDAKGRLFTARDRGCSCPSPFEDYHTIKDLERLTSFAPLEDERLNESYVDGWDEFKAKVRAALRALRTKA